MQTSKLPDPSFNPNEEYGGPTRQFEGTFPSIPFLIKKRLFRFIPMFHPRIFWRFRGLSLLVVLANLTYKSGIKSSIILIAEYLQWIFKLFFLSYKTKSTIEPISLRKLLKTSFLPEISSDDLAMVKLRKGR